ncbi:MAG: hypothetical protein ACOC4C_02815 [Fibrobacterota bacterium]
MIFFDQISLVHVAGLVILFLAILTALHSFALPRNFSKNQKVREKIRLQRLSQRQNFSEEEDSNTLDA